MDNRPETEEERQARQEREWEEFHWKNSIPWLILIAFFLVMLIGGAIGAMLTIH